MNSITGGGGTFDVRVHPATTQNQSLGGLVTWAFVLPPFRLNWWEDARPSTWRTQSLERFVCQSLKQSGRRDVYGGGWLGHGGCGRHRNPHPFVKHSSSHVIEPPLIHHPLSMSVTLMIDVLSILFHDLCFIDKIECIIQTKKLGLQYINCMGYVVGPKTTTLTQPQRGLFTWVFVLPPLNHWLDCWHEPLFYIDSGSTLGRMIDLLPQEVKSLGGPPDDPEVNLTIVLSLIFLSSGMFEVGIKILDHLTGSFLSPMIPQFPPP